MDAQNWQIRAPSSVIRDLQDPANVRLSDGTPLPDHQDDYMFLPADIDGGGVHVNSSIMNQGVYLLAEGGRHRRLRHDPDVEGIGVMNAARIVGAAAAWLLTPASDFEDARYAFAHAAEALHGEDSMEWIAVHSAMDAIGIPGTWVRRRNPSQRDRQRSLNRPKRVPLPGRPQLPTVLPYLRTPQRPGRRPRQPDPDRNP